jgi:hypothetical protein
MKVVHDTVNVVPDEGLFTIRLTLYLIKVVHDTVNVVHTKLKYLLKCSSVVSKTKCTPMICRNMLTISNKSRYALLCKQL